ncbi:MAG TPA: hypothetical protein VEX37_00755 [Thermomicrobiales bacterium]|nr:hypothetical protein [Thermomicrobiales bacterium]
MFRWVAASVMVFLLVACGGSNASDTDEPTATVASEPTATTAASATAAATETESGAVEPATETSESSVAATEPAAATESTAAPSATAGADESSFAFGWNVATRGDDEAEAHNRRTGEMVLDSGFGWVRFQLEWKQFERNDDQWDPLPIDRKVEELHSQGINILLAVAKAPDWVLANDGENFLNDYAQFEELMAFVSDRYKGKVQAWEIWNEQNMAYEMHGEVRVEDYFELLKAGHTGIRASDPDAKVVFGGLTPTGVTDPTIAIDDAMYLEQIYQYRDGEVRQYFDILGVHLISTHNAPDDTWPDNIGEHEGWNDHPSFFFRRGEELREIMVANGDADKPVWITEFGWTTENQEAGREYGVNNTEEEVAQYLTRALEIATTEWGDWTTGAFVWNLNWATIVEPEHHIYPSSALREDWSPRPAYEAMKAFPKS